MFNYQDFDVSAQEVRDRWVAASSSDPSNLLALTALAGAQQYLGNSQDALDPLAASGLRTLLGNRRWNLSRAGSGRDAGVRPALTRQWGMSVFEAGTPPLPARMNSASGIAAMLSSIIRWKLSI